MLNYWIKRAMAKTHTCYPSVTTTTHRTQGDRYSHRWEECRLSHQAVWTWSACCSVLTTQANKHPESTKTHSHSKELNIVGKGPERTLGKLPFDTIREWMGAEMGYPRSLTDAKCSKRGTGGRSSQQTQLSACLPGHVFPPNSMNCLVPKNHRDNPWQASHSSKVSNYLIPGR